MPPWENYASQAAASKGAPWTKYAAPSAQAPVKAEPHSMTAGEVVGGAIENFIPSAINTGKNIVQPILHPIETAKSVGKLGFGLVEKAIPGRQEGEQTADAVGKFFSDRYGGWENVKRTMADDPVGFLADASVVLGGGAAALKATGKLSQVANVLDKAGTVANPLTVIGKAGKAAASGTGKLASQALGVTTGAGPTAIRTAYQAGKAGGKTAEALQENMRGNVPMEDVVTTAKSAVKNLRSERGAQYRAGMGGVSADPTVLDFGGIDKVLSDVSSVKSYKGIDLSNSTAGIRKQISDRIEQWKALDPKEYHTVEGFDALKQSLSDIRDSTPFNTPERVIADNAYHAIRSEIIKQAPEYGKVMKAYETASDEIRDIERTLSLNPKANIDTSLRKLQSVMRDNVNTNYGNRGELAAMLVDAGATHLMEKLAGQALKSPTSRGLGKLLMGGELGAAIMSVFMGHPGTAGALIPALAAQSPRLAGEASYYLGKASRMGQAVKGSRVVPSRQGAVNAAQVGQLQTAGAQ